MQHRELVVVVVAILVVVKWRAVVVVVDLYPGDGSHLPGIGAEGGEGGKEQFCTTSG